MNPKTLFLLIVVVIVAFAAVVIWGEEREGGGGDLQPGWVESISGLFGQDLTLDDVGGAAPPACRQLLEEGRFVFDVGGVCTLRVGEASAPRRTLTLRLSSGSPVQVDVNHTAPNRLDEALSIHPSATEPTDVHFFEEGGTLTLACQPASTQCVVEVVEG